MGKKSRKKVEGHPGLLPGERVIDACYGLAGATRATADAAANGVLASERPAATSSGQSPGYSESARAPATGSSPFFRTNGIVALTDSRLVWCKVRTAIFKPRAVDATVPLSEVRNIWYERPHLVVEFADGTTAVLHTPAAEKPTAFVSAFDDLQSR